MAVIVEARGGTHICVPYHGFCLPARSPALRDGGRGVPASGILQCSS